MFFSKVDSYNFSQKLHISQFFILFLGEILRIISTIIAIALKDFKLRCKNSNLLVKKNVFQF